MLIEFDYNQINEITEKSCDEGIGDEILYKHNMTAVHTEILGQFLDQTNMSADDLIIVLNFGLTAFRKWISDGLEEMRANDKFGHFWEKYKSEK